jgi:hypothetical protein
MSLSIEELKERLANVGLHDRLVRTARERGYNYFRLQTKNAYAIYDKETDEKVSGKMLISAKEAIELMEIRVRHSELHGDFDPDNL